MGLFTTISILSSDFSCLKDTLHEAKIAGADMIHWDVMDGHFVPNLTFGAKLIDDFRPHSTLLFDTHLMISRPDKYLDSFLKTSDRITIHWESSSEVLPLLNKIKKASKDAGISIKPQTPINDIKPILPQLDLVLLMGVEPGFGGQSINENTFERVRELAQLRQETKTNFQIVIDGGVNLENSKILKNEGADGIVLGTCFINSKDKKKLIQMVKE